MKPSKRLKQSLRDIDSKRGKIPLNQWLIGQPRSTQKGVARGRFQLPAYVTK
jgi:hypothetical protein